MSRLLERPSRRIIILGLAGVFGRVWLAVGAGARGGTSVRAAGYPVTYDFHRVGAPRYRRDNRYMDSSNVGFPPL